MNVTTTLSYLSGHGGVMCSLCHASHCLGVPAIIDSLRLVLRGGGLEIDLAATAGLNVKLAKLITELFRLRAESIGEPGAMHAQ